MAGFYPDQLADKAEFMAGFYPDQLADKAEFMAGFYPDQLADTTTGYMHSTRCRLQ